MTTPSTSAPQLDISAVELCDSIFEYRERVHQPADKTPRQIRLRTIEVHHGDGDVGIYDGEGTFLACEEGRDKAMREAEFVITAYVNCARWAVHELAAGRGHLQRYFSEIATRHGCPPAVPNGP